MRLLYGARRSIIDSRDFQTWLACVTLTELSTVTCASGGMADALASGASARLGRGGSTPLSRTNKYALA